MIQPTRGEGDGYIKLIGGVGGLQNADIICKMLDSYFSLIDFQRKSIKFYSQRPDTLGICETMIKVKKEEHAELGVPHSRIQVELVVNVQVPGLPQLQYISLHENVVFSVLFMHVWTMPRILYLSCGIPSPV